MVLSSVEINGSIASNDKPGMLNLLHFHKPDSFADKEVENVMTTWSVQEYIVSL